MEVRVNKNINLKTKEDLFGLSIKPTGGYRYCKYPIGYQDYRTMPEAIKGRQKVIEKLNNGASIYYGQGGSQGVNKNEIVRIVDPKENINKLNK